MHAKPCLERASGYIICKFVIFFSLLLERISCGSRPAGTRIVGGTQAQNGSWPWMAMLAFAGGSQFCGGSLIFEQWVLTTAGCVDGYSPPDIVVRLVTVLYWVLIG